jgi:hypothetical protein
MERRLIYLDVGDYPGSSLEDTVITWGSSSGREKQKSQRKHIKTHGIRKTQVVDIGHRERRASKEAGTL